MKAITHWLRHAWLTLLVAGTIILLDQWTKTLVRANLVKFDYYPVLGEWFGWQHVDNYGAAFGIFQNARIVLTIVAVVVLIAILIFVRSVPTDKRLLRVLLGMQLGGATGNLIDRASQGFVTDFVKMGIPDVYYWPNWNVADSAIVAGVVSLAIYIIAEDIATARRAKREQQQIAGE